jgi:hypothetical protein
MAVATSAVSPRSAARRLPVPASDDAWRATEQLWAQPVYRLAGREISRLCVPLRAVTRRPSRLRGLIVNHVRRARHRRTRRAGS